MTIKLNEILQIKIYKIILKRLPNITQLYIFVRIGTVQLVQHGRYGK